MSPAGFPGEDEPDPPPPKFKFEVGRSIEPSEPNPPAGHPLSQLPVAQVPADVTKPMRPDHPLAGLPRRLVDPHPGDLSGSYPQLRVNLADVTEEALQRELARRAPVGELRGLLANVPIEAINAELSRRFQGVALIALQVAPVGPQSPSGAMELAVRDMYYTSVRGVPLPALAGCVQKLADDLQQQSKRVEIKPT